jgi:cytochrome c-type biogenesis protein CcmF
MHYFIGNLGHFLVITSFVLSLLAAFAYFQYANDGFEVKTWRNFARTVFYMHAVSVIGVIATLFFIINGHYFEYHYAYQHSSRILPVYYQISCFWEGQEGSFLLWTFWNVVLGLILMNTNKYWEAPVMTIFTVVQAFLTSMILGIEILGLKIGSSPFMLLRDAIAAPIFQMTPDFVPEDGTGLNPLLQNYWMVIHPPTLFLGFATTLIPFAYAFSGLWMKKPKEWIRPALPWSIVSALVLGVGILMGAYWAYETLNFGGYWNWDPVENAIYVPWLVLIAAIHTMIAFKKNSTALKAAIILALSVFLTILYATFLTRSGILGDTSVHSFTDLGLSGQLLIYLLTFLFISIGIAIWRWKTIPKTDQEVSVYSREFWIFIGATTLCLMGFQVILPTSIPVYNSIVGLFGGISNVAPPVDQIAFYTKFQLWFAVAVAILSGTGQLFWWQKMTPNELKSALSTPVIIALLLSSTIIVISKMTTISYMILLTASIYSIVANLKILASVVKSNFKLSGGAIAHIGIAMMLLGILFSSGYSTIISTNTTGLLWHKDFPEEVNRDNLLLFIQEPRQMGDYTLNYKGMVKEVTGFPEYVKMSHVVLLPDPMHAIAKKDLEYDGKRYFSKGDTLKFESFENSYFEIDYSHSSGRNFTLYPRVQINEAMNMTVYSPDIKRTIPRDLYTHVRTFPDPEQETIWNDMEEQTLKIGEQFFINDFVAVLESVARVDQLNQVALDPKDVAVKASIKMLGNGEEYYAEPIYLIKDKMVGRIPDEITDLASKITLLAIDPEQGSFTIGTNTRQKDWVILEAVEKPLINILWIGTLLLVLGFSVAISRRYSEFSKMRDKGQE